MHGRDEKNLQNNEWYLGSPLKILNNKIAFVLEAPYLVKINCIDPKREIQKHQETFASKVMGDINRESFEIYNT